VEQTGSRDAAAVGRDRSQFRLAFGAEIGMVPPIITKLQHNKTPFHEGERCLQFRGLDVRVIASSIRKGNIIEREDGQLCVVLSAESFHPGKGTPTTQIDMRRLSDGVKVTDRFKTTEQVERAFVEDKDFDFLYSDGDGYHFMNAETYDQLQVPKDIIGDQAQWLQEGMKVILSVFDGSPVAIQLPPRVTLEVAETEPAMKGQTASSSYKPAKLANGARVMVPPHIAVGVRVVIQTEDGGYVERAKD
jgi:elongation factor P